jgi:Phosphotransferase enzyme family
MSEIARLSERVRAQLLVQGPAFGLNPSKLAIEPILNWGGFVNRSFRVADGGSTCFLKLTSDAEIQRGLRRWRKNADLLEASYHAPRMRGWLEPDDWYCGPLFEWIDGAPATDLSGPFANDICTVIRDLHGDQALAQRLAEDDTPVESCAHAFLRSYHDRFVEDLVFIDSKPPSFVSAELRRWMWAEAALLAKMVRESLAFQELAGDPVHADLWLNNTLVDSEGRWYLLDWDGLSLGDAVMDWCMLFGPARERPQEPDVDAVMQRVSLTPAQKERLPVYARAALLDWIIDPLSDWVGAAQEPEHGTQVRAANERVHRAALERYRTAFGG